MAAGLTIADIMAKCPERVKYGARVAVIRGASSKVLKDKRQRLTCKVATTHTLDDRRKPPPPMVTHLVTVETLEPGKYIGARDARVKVSCNCPDYWSTWEVALHKKGSADIRYSNGDPPDTKNPRMIPGCCKHLFAVFLGIRGKRIPHS